MSPGSADLQLIDALGSCQFTHEYSSPYYQFYPVQYHNPTPASPQQARSTPRDMYLRTQESVRQCSRCGGAGEVQGETAGSAWRSVGWRRQGEGQYAPGSPGCVTVTDDLLAAHPPARLPTSLSMWSLPGSTGTYLPDYLPTCMLAYLSVCMSIKHHSIQVFTPSCGWFLLEMQWSQFKFN